MRAPESGANADQFTASASKHQSPTKRYCRSQPVELVASSANRAEGTFMPKKVADQLAETLAALGVKRVYGVVGDSLNGILDCHRYRVPVLAIAAQIPSPEIGSS